MGSIVRHEFCRYIEACNYMVEEKVGYHVSRVVERGHGPNTFGKVIDKINDVILNIIKGGITFHEVNPQFAKGANGVDVVDRRKWCSTLNGEYLEIDAMFD